VGTAKRASSKPLDGLRALECRARRAGRNPIELELPQDGEPWHPPEQASVELSFLLRAWPVDSPEVEFRLVP